MTINFNVTGAERKRLADCIAGFLGCERKYLGVPSCAYQTGYITISMDGAISFDDRADSTEIETLLKELDTEGFHAAPVCAETEPETLATDNTAVMFDGEQSEDVGLTVTIPMDKVNPQNLTALLDAKGSLIKKALGIEALPVEVGESTVAFPWFSKLPEPDEVTAFTHFISALCEMSINQKRITAKEKTVENEKYAFRCFLLRLGFIGAQFKSERKVLLRNLTGSSAFKSGNRAETVDDEVHEN